MQNRGFRYRLYPTDEQNARLRQFAGVARAVYNTALYQREHFWRHYRRQTGKSLGYLAQARGLTALRDEFDWIGDAPVAALQQALLDLDKAFTNFFTGRSGYPTPRRKGVNESFRFLGRDVEIKRLNRRWSAVRLPKIGWVRYRNTRPLPIREVAIDKYGRTIGRKSKATAVTTEERETILSVTVTMTPLGPHISFACEVEDREPLRLNTSVGIDRGVANTIALSKPLDGRQLDGIDRDRLNLLDRRCRAAQKAANRRRRGSKRYAKARRRAAAVKAEAARVRKHFNHTRTTALTKNFGVVYLEDLRISNMTASARGSVEAPGKNVRQKAGLNRSILEQGWFQFETFLAYKLAAAGGQLIKVPAANTSRRCQCGCVDPRNRESQAQFRCIECGYEAHADIHAAENIERAGTAPSVGAPAPGRKPRR